MKLKRYILLIVILMFTLNGLGVFSNQSQEVKVPTSMNYISDYAQIIDQATEEKMHHLIAKLENKKGCRIMVLTVKSVNKTDIASYSSQVITSWHLRDRDVLLIVSLENGKVYLDVGKKLKSVLPEEKVQEIINEKIIPSFNQGNFSQGIHQGVSTLSSIILESRLSDKTDFFKPLLISLPVAAFAIVVLMLIL